MDVQVDSGLSELPQMLRSSISHLTIGKSPTSFHVAEKFNPTITNFNAGAAKASIRLLKV